MEWQLSTLLQAAINLTNADMGTLQIALGRRLRLAATRGFSDDFGRFFAIVEDENCACGVAMASGAPVIVEDVRASPIFAGKHAGDVMLTAGAQSVISIPIRLDGRLLGMLSTHRRVIKVPDHAELDRLRWISREAAGVLEGTATGLSWRAIELLARG
jgi:GAF domain-containing protein